MGAAPSVFQKVGRASDTYGELAADASTRSHRCSAKERHNVSPARPLDALDPHIGAIQYTASLQQFAATLKAEGNASPLGAIVKSNGRSDFNQRHSVFLRHRHGTGVHAQLWLLGETCRRVRAQMGYASLDKCKSWQRADSKLHVPDGTQQKAQLHKSPLN